MTLGAGLVITGLTLLGVKDLNISFFFVVERNFGLPKAFTALSKRWSDFFSVNFNEIVADFLIGG
jgi:hypothetical protein